MITAFPLAADDDNDKEQKHTVNVTMWLFYV